MNDFLEISEEVAMYLPPETLAGLRRARQNTRLKCFVCERSIPPESEEKVTISLFSDPIELCLVARPAHADCAPSQVNVLDIPRDAMAEAWAGASSIVYLQAVFPLADPIAMLFWEPRLSVMLPDAADNVIYPVIEHYRALGFVPDEQVPTLDGWEFRIVESDLVLYRDGTRMEQFAAAMENAPDGWLNAMKSTGVCIVVVGVGLGLDRFDQAEFPKARAEGRAICAAIPV